MENQMFKTKDTNLAAYLMCNGAEYFEARKEEGLCVFAFSKNEKTMELFNDFKKDTWLKNYNDNKKYCLNTIRDVKNQQNQA
ncbi:DUF5659 domain-containing protein [Dehalobacter sp. TeCB1]|jgi:hypothetical protein|uniref:DUF5659 domain-containing protein n=1 Tax=Dehalobacter sp. TeCB1 TaxID=1843715 RepID=UPI00083B434E|nr:DUF5659 domain-containing protein [Dehalobacter sp. TeCB1]OCZ52199.1 hypothetical protein A7D23_11340 [Dehalobacter sp. TeCB1]